MVLDLMVGTSRRPRVCRVLTTTDRFNNSLQYSDTRSPWIFCNKELPYIIDIVLSLSRSLFKDITQSNGTIECSKITKIR